MNRTDDELIEILRQYPRESQVYQQAMNDLLEKYKDMVRRKARAYYLAGGDYEDLIQEGMIGLYNAALNYQKDRGTSFATFAGLCVERKISSAVKASLREKQKILTQAVPIDEMTDLPETLSPEQLISQQDRERELKSRLEETLSPLEKKVFSLFMNGLTYTEIACRLGISRKSADNAMQRIKRKASQLEAFDG